LRSSQSPKTQASEEAQKLTKRVETLHSVFEREQIRLKTELKDMNASLHNLELRCDAKLVVIGSRDSEIGVLKLEFQQFKSQAHSATRENWESQDCLAGYPKIMGSAVSEAMPCRRGLEPPDLSDEFVDIYPFDHGTKRSDLPARDHTDKTRSTFKRTFWRGIREAPGGDTLEAQISGMESRNS
jgi:hypothetical protein